MLRSCCFFLCLNLVFLMWVSHLGLPVNSFMPVTFCTERINASPDVTVVAVLGVVTTGLTDQPPL